MGGQVSWISMKRKSVMYMQGLIFCHRRHEEKCNNLNLYQKNLRSCVGPSFSCTSTHKKFQVNWTLSNYTCFTKQYHPFHSTMTMHADMSTSHVAYECQCHIGVKLFLSLSCAIRKHSTNFENFRSSFGTFR